MTRKEALKEIDDHLDMLAEYHSEDRDKQDREIDGATYRALRKSRFLIDKICDLLEQHIEELEAKIAYYEFEMEAYRQCEEQLKACETALEEAEQHITELSSELAAALVSTPKTCEGCKHHSYKTEHYGLCHRNGFPEDTAYYWICGGYEPKDLLNE